jgi:Fe-Mn family superoxide dismutase
MMRGEKAMDVVTTYTPKNYDRLLGTPGFSDALLKNHFTLYQGYVKNTNALAETLAGAVEEGKNGTPAYSELKRRFGWEFNGMRLHELYFENMTKSVASLTATSHSLAHALAWQKDFVSVGAMRGIGWVILYHDQESGRFFNVWINEHDGGHLSGATPLLVMDVFEHAYVLDYGIKKMEYLEAFMKAIDWRVVSQRFKAK